MKKLAIILVILVMLFCLSSCVTVQTQVELSQDRANIKSVEIFNSERAYDVENIDNFLEENKPVAVLEWENINSFLDALCSLEFSKEVVLFPMPMDGGYDYQGYIVAITYLDGGYDIFAEEGLFSYSIGKKGQGLYKYDHSNYCGEVLWSDFIQEYTES